jgi:hypothetical protein
MVILEIIIEFVEISKMKQQFIELRGHRRCVILYGCIVKKVKRQTCTSTTGIESKISTKKLVVKM